MTDKDQIDEKIAKAVGSFFSPDDDYVRKMLDHDLPLMTVGDGDKYIEEMARLMSGKGVPSFIGFDSITDNLAPGAVRVITSRSNAGMSKLATIALAGDPYHIPPMEVAEKIEHPRLAGSKHTQSKVPIAYTERVGPPGERRVNKKAKAKNRAKNKAARKNRHK